MRSPLFHSTDHGEDWCPTAFGLINDHSLCRNWLPQSVDEADKRYAGSRSNTCVAAMIRNRDNKGGTKSRRKVTD